MTCRWSSCALACLSLLIATGCGASAPTVGAHAMGTPSGAPAALGRFAQLNPDSLEEVIETLEPLVHSDMLRLVIGHLPESLRMVNESGPTPLFDELLSLKETLRSAGAIAVYADFDRLKARLDSVPPTSRYASPHATHERQLALLQVEVLGWHAAIEVAHELGGPLVNEAFLQKLPSQFGHFGRALFDALVPADATYKTLLAAYATLQGQLNALDGPETQLPVDTDWYPTLFGTKKPRILLLRKRLAELGFFAPPVSEMRSFDSSIERQLRAFQTRHSLEPTGRPNVESARCLNVSLSRRIAEVAGALQQRRQDPLRGVPERLSLNLPAFELQRFSGGERIATHKVVIGANEPDIDPFGERRGPINRTPTLVSSITQIVLNPTWEVPRRIKELVLDPLADHDPRRYDDFHLITGPDGVEQAIQLPGPKNALGRVKFVLSGTPIVLHGTPGRRPFKLRQRALSHGDVRVQMAPDLAKGLLASDGNEITPKHVASVLKTRHETFVTLETPVPVSIYYTTVDVGPDGSVRFLPDVYDSLEEGRGAELARTLGP
ncbi:MAG: L,D-transpeptidase family protein [Myxococcota bacterium]